MTGGAGYIGSHTCITLLEAGHSVIIADNFSNSKRDTVNKIMNITNKKLIFYEVDVTEYRALNEIFKNNDLDGVIHFAGFKAVGESIASPLEYYNNNIISTIMLAKVCQKYNVNHIVFSSSATVYGNNKVPFIETMDLLPSTNPYGETKAMSERILQDFANANPKLCLSILRYFNPVGAHKSGLLGEEPSGTPNNLMPYITQVAKGKLERLQVYGNDYPTSDGTGIRDYIHVVDLAEGHLAALKKSKEGTHIYNLGTGIGTSVFELLHTFIDTNKVDVPYEVVNKRPGDIVSSYADVSKAKKKLGWQAKYSLVEMCRDSWRFEKNNF